VSGLEPLVVVVVVLFTVALVGDWLAHR